MTDAAGEMTRYTYDAAGRIVGITDPRGITYLTNEYDAQGRVVRQTPSCAPGGRDSRRRGGGLMPAGVSSVLLRTVRFLSLVELSRNTAFMLGYRDGVLGGKVSRQHWRLIVKFGVASGLGTPIIGAVVFRLLFAILERSWVSIVTIPFVGLPEVLAVVLFGPVAFGLGVLGTWLLVRERSVQRLHLKGMTYGLLFGLISPPLAALTHLLIRRTIASEPGFVGQPTDVPTIGFDGYAMLFEVTAAITGALVGWIIGRKIRTLRASG